MAGTSRSQTRIRGLNVLRSVRVERIHRVLHERHSPRGYDHLTDVESELPSNRSTSRDPGCRRPDQTSSLRRVDGGGRPRSRAETACLYLDEGDDLPIARDEVDLVATAPPVAIQNLQPASLEPAGCNLLAVPSGFGQPALSIHPCKVARHRQQSINIGSPAWSPPSFGQGRNVRSQPSRAISIRPVQPDRATSSATSVARRNCG